MPGEQMGKPQNAWLTGDTDLASVIYDLDYSQLTEIFRQLFPDRDADELIIRILEILNEQRDEFSRRLI